MKTILTFAVSLVFASQLFAAGSQPFGSGDGAASKIESANKSGKAVFLVVFDKNGPDKDKAMSIAKEALAKKPAGAQVIELNTVDTDNSGLIAKYRLAGAPLPLILVLDKNGTAAGGYTLAQATPDGLVSVIPSPKFSEILSGLSTQKSVLIVAYKESMVKKTTAIAKCNEAVKSMNDGAITVELNIDNKEEATLLNNLKVNTLATEPVIYAINKAGQITGTFPCETATTQLVLAANKVAASSCCPTGSASGSCAPTKK